MAIPAPGFSSRPTNHMSKRRPLRMHGCLLCDTWFRCWNPECVYGQCPVEKGQLCATCGLSRIEYLADELRRIVGE